MPGCVLGAPGPKPSSQSSPHLTSAQHLTLLHLTVQALRLAAWLPLSQCPPSGSPSLDSLLVLPPFPDRTLVTPGLSPPAPHLSFLSLPCHLQPDDASLNSRLPPTACSPWPPNGHLKLCRPRAEPLTPRSSPSASQPGQCWTYP